MSIGARISDQAWALATVSALLEGAPARGPAMAHRLGASRAAIAAALDHLVALGILRANPGHGHPLRPAFLVRDRARAERAALAWQAVRKAEVEALARQKWTLPILAALPAAQSFSGLRRALAPITPRALSIGLQGLEAAGLVTRTIVDAAPPATLYQATAKAGPIVAAVQGDWL
jgi:DNA-binding HxlR family transcriptional regulator